MADQHLLLLLEVQRRAASAAAALQVDERIVIF
jgi:hypothetical protein